MIRLILTTLLLIAPVAAQTQVADNYDTTSGSGGYRIGGQTVIRWEGTMYNFVCGKVPNVFNAGGGQQNFMCGNVVQMPTGIANTAFGWDTGRPTTGFGNTFFGHDAGLGINTGSGNTFIGMQAGPPDQSGSIQVNGSIGLGSGAVTTASSQLVIGGSAWPVKQAFLGAGVTGRSPQALTLQTTGGSGNNNRGASLVIAAGRSTGSATPATITFSTTNAGPSGTIAQPLVPRWEIDGEGALKSLNGSIVEANLQLVGGTKPTCTEATRGLMWQTFGGTGTGDALEICQKSANGLYSWRTLLFPQ